MAELKAIRGGLQPAATLAVELLRDLLSRAERGDVVEVACICQAADGHLMLLRTGELDYRVGCAGAAMLTKHLLNEAEANSEPIG